MKDNCEVMFNNRFTKRCQII